MPSAADAEVRANTRLAAISRPMSAGCTGLRWPWSSCRARFAAGPGQPADGRRLAVDPRRGTGVLEHPSGDLVLAGPPYVVALFEPGEDAIQDPDAGGVAGQSLVQADDHQAPPLGALVVELVELVDELLLVGGGVEGGEIKAGDVVEVHRVGHRRERTAVDRLQERLVG